MKSRDWNPWNGDLEKFFGIPSIPSSVHIKSRDWNPWNGDLQKNLEYIYINHSFHTHSIWNPWNGDL
jgi:hypothetical protein